MCCTVGVIIQDCHHPFQSSFLSSIPKTQPAFLNNLSSRPVSIFLTLPPHNSIQESTMTDWLNILRTLQTLKDHSLLSKYSRLCSFQSASVLAFVRGDPLHIVPSQWRLVAYVIQSSCNPPQFLLEVFSCRCDDPGGSLTRPLLCVCLCFSHS